MPQASEELRAKMLAYFFPNDPDISLVGDLWPDQFLRSAGWTETKLLWHKPASKTTSDITEKEWDCMQYLIDEWDHSYSAV